MEDDFFLGKHPLASLEGAGCMQLVLRKQFHCLLQTVANKMPNVSELVTSLMSFEEMCSHNYCNHT